MTSMIQIDVHFDVRATPTYDVSREAFARAVGPDSTLSDKDYWAWRQAMSRLTGEADMDLSFHALAEALSVLSCQSESAGRVVNAFKNFGIASHDAAESMSKRTACAVLTEGS